MAGHAEEAWTIVPTTILIGRSDIAISAEQQEQLRTQFHGVRVIDGDYFLPLLRPDMVAEVIVETFATAS
jgi:surfactin synthase thioesterase subunit